MSCNELTPSRRRDSEQRTNCLIWQAERSTVHLGSRHLSESNIELSEWFSMPSAKASLLKPERPSMPKNLSVQVGLPTIGAVGKSVDCAAEGSELRRGLMEQLRSMGAISSALQLTSEKRKEDSQKKGCGKIDRSDCIFQLCCPRSC